MTKLPKYIFSVDAESDGLHGPIFAIGVVVLDWKGNLVDQFAGQAESELVTDKWVKDNVLPQLKDLRSYPTRKKLREEFWKFWLEYIDESLCLSDTGFPVEANLFRECIEDSPKIRRTQGPYPLYDLNTFFLAKDLEHKNMKRKDFLKRTDLKEHHPQDDALASALAFLKLYHND